MAANLERLLAPVSDDNPVGPDLSYDNERQQIEQAFESNQDSSGESDEDRDWRPIVRLIENQFGQTKDVWLAAYLCRAGAKMGSLETVELGAQALAGLFEQYWATVHPQLDELGLPGRKAPCDSLASRGEFLLPLERTVLIAHPRLGAFTGQDIERFRTEHAAADGYGMFRAALEELGDSGLQEAIGRIDAIEDGLRRADKIFMTEAGGEPSPNFAPTYGVLAQMRQGLASFLTEGDAAGEGAEAGGAPASAAAAPAAAVRGLSGRIDSREDVIKALDMIGEYYRRSEPSHPMQLLMTRAREWVEMDFMSLMRDIAPDAVYQAGQVLNKRE